MSANQFPGTCDYCRNPVPAGAGIISGRTHDDKTRIVHWDCIPEHKPLERKTA